MREDIFIAGADIRELQSTASYEIGSLIKRGQALFEKIERLPSIVIAAINGVCFGGGNELAMSCDIRIASDNAHFGQPEIKLGLIPGWGGIERLVRLVGKSMAQEMLFTGKPIDAQKALQSGLIHKVVRKDELLLQARTIAHELAQNAPLAVEYTKEALQRAAFVSPGEFALIERLFFEKLFRTEDAQEGIKAFLSRRLPSFKGR
jgi:enoyl-CoA hydratase/carnithine racemase